MKKVFLIIFIFQLFFIPSLADDDGEIYLDLNTNEETLHLKTPQNFNPQKLHLTPEKDYNITPQNIYEYRSKTPQDKHSTSYTREKTFGNFSIGTKTDSTFAPETYTQTSTMFAKYNKNRFTLNTSYKSNSFASLDKTGKGTFAFTPEYKLNNHVTLQNVYSTNFMDRNRKNELIFSLQPFKDDRMNFNVGAGQIYSDNSSPIRSQLNFSTKIKF